MCKVIAIANQKGGVGKTITTLSLGVALAKQGKKVLLVDADPQGNLTTCMGFNENDFDTSLAYLMEAEIADVDINSENTVLHSNENVDLIPSDIVLSAIELSLNNTMSREYVMKNALSKLKDKYDYVLIDCMPSLGMITINALACSDEIIIPVQSQYLAVKGMTYLFDTIRKVNKTINPDLSIKGILVTLVDKRTNLSKVIKDELENAYGGKIKIYDTEIPLAIKTAEASLKGQSVFEYDKNGTVALSYNNFAKEVLEDEQRKSKNKSAIIR